MLGEGDREDDDITYSRGDYVGYYWGVSYYCDDCSRLIKLYYCYCYEDIDEIFLLFNYNYCF